MIEKRVRVQSGAEIGYVEYGDPAGHPVIYFHGGMSSATDIAFADTICSELGIWLIAPDRPGVGATPYQRGWTIQRWCEDVVHLADLLTIERFSTLGWSAGGPYVLALSEHSPHRIHSAGVIGSIAPLTAPGRVKSLSLIIDRILFPLARFSPLLANLLMAFTPFVPSWIVKRVLLHSVKGSADYRFISSQKSVTAASCRAFRRGPRGTVRDYFNLGGEWKIDFSAISSKVMIFHGDEDRLVPPFHAALLNELLENSEKILFDSCGHFVLHEKCREVFSFLAKSTL